MWKKKSKIDLGGTTHTAVADKGDRVKLLSRQPAAVGEPIGYSFDLTAPNVDLMTQLDMEHNGFLNVASTKLAMSAFKQGLRIDDIKITHDTSNEGETRHIHFSFHSKNPIISSELETLKYKVSRALREIYKDINEVKEPNPDHATRRTQRGGKQGKGGDNNAR